jgi:ubiquinone/menaquinone biosynthesis C-methylase UbiE
MRRYYDRRAPEYDDWWLGRGLFAGRPRPGWSDEVAQLVAVLESMPPARTLDVACGTGSRRSSARAASCTTEAGSSP